MEYWTDLYNEISNRITQNLPEIKWVDLWYGQVSNQPQEQPFPEPAIFLAFSTVAINDRGGLVQDCDTQVDLYLFYKTTSGNTDHGNTSGFLNQLTHLHTLFHGQSGQNFGTMRRTDMRREDSGGIGNLYRVSFQCLITDYSAKHIFTEREAPDADLSLTKQEKASPTPPDNPTFDI